MLANGLLIIGALATVTIVVAISFGLWRDASNQRKRIDVDRKFSVEQQMLPSPSAQSIVVRAPGSSPSVVSGTASSNVSVTEHFSPVNG